MHPTDRRLVRDITLVIVLKLIPHHRAVVGLDP